MSYNSLQLPSLYTQFRELYPATYRVQVKIKNPRYVAAVSPEFTMSEGGMHFDAITVPMSPEFQAGISGHVELSEAPAPVTVGAYLVDPSGSNTSLQNEAMVDSDTGDYLIPDLPAGDYTVRFIASGAAYANEWWDDKWFSDVATVFTVLPAQITPHIDATLTPDGPPPSIGRIYCHDRFETSAKLAQAFTTMGGVVFVANGLSFADALGAAAAASHQSAPLLLTQRDSLPTSVVAEITRLRPKTIYVVGGTGAVSPIVFNQLDALATGDAIRISGPNRYATSREIMSMTFDTARIPFLLVATGRDYPDALSAAAAAHLLGSPVLLIDGTSPHLDSATKVLLQTMARLPEKVYIAGGVGVVSAGIEQDFRDIGFGPDGVVRLGGADRYATSVLLIDEFFTDPNAVFFATGASYPDALAGAARATHDAAPLYLVRPTCVPSPTMDSMAASEAKITRITLLGGPSVLSNSVAALTVCP